MHSTWWSPEADWIRWTGVAIAVAGTLIATPDGTLATWRGMTRAGGRVVDWLARCLPFLHRKVDTELKEAADAGDGAEHLSVSRRFEWDVQAGDGDKIELLHQQVELIRQELGDIRQEIPRVEARLGLALERSEARQQNAHQQLTGRLEAREQRAARVDAHGIWPIGAGIVLTGIPGELAAPVVLGWLFMAAGIGVTIHAACAVRSDRATLTLTERETALERGATRGST